MTASLDASILHWKHHLLATLSQCCTQVRAAVSILAYEYVCGGGGVKNKMLALCCVHTR
jgi:hypothetical protein